ncbi:MAG: hypothetical protein EOM50_09270 [Erysipelotrichia bacterium]|nr:hypothetical protein [Erysipelotrichia bacterium]
MEPSKKEEELYKASLQAFFQNELEHDKTVLGLSTAALGFYIAIFQSDKEISEVMFITSIIAIVMFAITILLILLIFIYNKKLLMSIIKTSGKGEEIKELSILDKTKYIPFAMGILMSIIFTLSLIYQSKPKELVIMAENQSKQEQSKSSSYKERAFNGIVSSNQDTNETKKPEPPKEKK